MQIRLFNAIIILIIASVMELIMAGVMLYWSWILFSPPLSILRFSLSLLQVTFLGIHLSILAVASSSCLLTAKLHRQAALFVAVLTLAFGLWSMVVTRKNEGWYYLTYEILVIFVVTFEGFLFAEVVKVKQ